MRFSELVGQQNIIQELVDSKNEGRIPHAQLFAGPTGAGALALVQAYAQFLNCKNPEPNDSCGQCDSCKQMAKWAHPNLSVILPSPNLKDKTLSKDFLPDFRKFFAEQPFGELGDWSQFLEEENKAVGIRVAEAQQLMRELSLTAFGEGFRIVILWEAHLMNQETANKLLKVFEEPPKDTVFLATSTQAHNLLATISSRFQTWPLKLANSDELSRYLVQEKGMTEVAALAMIQLKERQLNSLSREEEQSWVKQEFVAWTRACFVSDLTFLVPWAEAMHGKGRNALQVFFEFAIHLYRQAMLGNYGMNELQLPNQDIESFKLERFAPFANGANIISIIEALNEAAYHIARNASAKIVLLDLSIQLSRLLRIKESA